MECTVITHLKLFVNFVSSFFPFGKRFQQLLAETTLPTKKIKERLRNVLADVYNLSKFKNFIVGSACNANTYNCYLIITNNLLELVNIV